MAWLNGWGFRKAATIAPSSGAGSNYQIKVIVNASSGTDSGSNVYLNGASKNDFSDIRFTANDGVTLLNYWQETASTVYGVSAVFWVQVTDDLDSSNVIIYLYYGNFGAVSTSSGSNTFIFFDDFGSFVPNWIRQESVFSICSWSNPSNYVVEPALLYEGNPVILTQYVNVFKMWYRGGWASPNTYIGYAESPDGVNWTDYSSNPLNLSGGIGLVGQQGPFVVRVNSNTLYLYCSSGGGATIDLFSSSDGINWTLVKHNIVGIGGANPAVYHFAGESWKMYFQVYAGSYWATDYATSSDGINWTLYSGNPVSTAGIRYVYKANDGTYWGWGSNTSLPTDLRRSHSSDGINWTITPEGITFPRLTWSEGMFGTVGQVADPFLLIVNGYVYMFYDANSNGGSPDGDSHISLAIFYGTFEQLIQTTENYDANFGQGMSSSWSGGTSYGSEGYSYLIYNPSTSQSRVVSNTSFGPYNIALRTRRYQLNVPSGSTFYILGTGTISDTQRIAPFFTSTAITTICGTNNTPTNWSTSGNHIVDIIWVSSSEVDLYEDGVARNISPITSGIPSSASNAYVSSYNTLFMTDWILVRKYTSPEPYISAWQTASVPPIYSIDTVLEEVNINKTCGIDTIFSFTNPSDVYLISTFSPPDGINDVRLRKAGPIHKIRTYLADIVLEKFGVTKTNSIDTTLKKFGITKTYSIDTRFAQRVTSTYSIDTMMKKFGVTVTDSVDTIFKKLIAGSPTYSIDCIFVNWATAAADIYMYPAYSPPDGSDDTRLYPHNPSITEAQDFLIDIILEKLEVTKTDSIDTVFKKLGITTTTDSIDTLFKKLKIPITYSIDTIFKKFGVTKTNSIDTVFEALGVTKTDSVDIVFKRLNLVAAYSFDTVLTRLGVQITSPIDVIFNKLEVITTSPYSIDTVLKKFGLTKTDQIDALFAALGLSTYQIDAIFQKRITRTESIDSVFKKYKITVTDSIDVIFKKLGIGKTYELDTLLKKLGVTRTYLADLILKRLGINVPYLLDVSFKKNKIQHTYLTDTIFLAGFFQIYPIDTVIKKFGIKKTDSVDTILGKLEIHVPYEIDTLFEKFVPLPVIVDAVFKKLKVSKAYSIDTIEKKLGITKPYSIDTLLKRVGIEKEYNIDVILNRLHIPISYVIDVLFKAVISVGYSIDTILKLPYKQASFLLDVVLQSAIIVVPIGGGHPEEMDKEPRWRIDYIDRVYEIPVKALARVSNLQKKKVSVEPVNLVIAGGVELPYAGLTAYQYYSYKVPVEPLTVMSEQTIEVPVNSLTVMEEQSLEIFVKHLNTPIQESVVLPYQPIPTFIKYNAEIGVVPLTVLEPVTISIPVSKLTIVSKGSVSASVVSLISKKKKLTPKEWMQLMDELMSLD